MAAKIVWLEDFNICEDGSREFFAPEMVVALMEPGKGTVFLSAHYGGTQASLCRNCGYSLSPKNITIPSGQVHRLIGALQEVASEGEQSDIPRAAHHSPPSGLGESE
jgi:hypothetical protein